MKFLTAAILSALLCIASTCALAADAKFDGRWMLDLQKSRNLPRPFQNVASHQLIVNQDGNKVNVQIDITNTLPDAPKFSRLLTYVVDGEETNTETTIRTPAGVQNIHTTISARSKSDGGLHLIFTREQKNGEAAKKMVNTEDWELSGDAKTLIVHCENEMPDGSKAVYDLVFVR